MQNVNFSVGDTTSESSISDLAKAFLPDDTNAKKVDEKFTCKTLKEKCLEVLVTNFSRVPVPAEKLTPKILHSLLSRVHPQDLDPSVMVKHIHSETFWKRASIQKYGLARCSIEHHGLSWKRLYFEVLMNETLQNINLDDGHIESSLLEMAEAIQEHVFSLEMRGPKNESITKIFARLPNMTNLDVRYEPLVVETKPDGKNNLDDSHLRKLYDRENSGMQLGDADVLAKSLQTIARTGGCLCSLALTNSKINDDLVRLLTDGLANAQNGGGANIRDTLVHLDVSHNKITTNGLRLLVNYFLDATNQSFGYDDDDGIESNNSNYPVSSSESEAILATFIVADNRIHAEGGRCLGRLVRNNKSLVCLNIRLNRLEDEGGAMLIDGLKYNDTLRHLNLASNSLSRQSVSALVSVLESKNKLVNTSGEPSSSRLESIDLSSNNVNESDLEQLASVLRHTSHLMSLDVRNEKIDKNSEALKKLEEKLLQNELGM